MFHFVAEKIADGEGKDEPLLTPARMRDVVDHLDVVALFGAVKGHNAVAQLHAPSVGKREFRKRVPLLLKRGVVHAPRVGVKKIHDELASRGQMPRRRTQAGKLLLGVEEMLKGPERNCDQSKRSAKIERSHIALNDGHTALRVRRQRVKLFFAPR